MTAALERRWQFASTVWSLGQLPRIMGIINATPDSFSDGGDCLSASAAVDRGLQLAAEGADLLDIGGESTRPGAEPVSESEELARVIPVIEQLAASENIPISIDTMKAGVAQEALAAGASIVNDVSGLLFDPRMVDVCAGSRCGVVIMHMQGTPQTMQLNPHYEDVVREVSGFLRDRVEELAQRGIAPERIVVDPGIGFGKTAAHNLEILSHVSALREFGRPVLIGHSRKRFLGKLIGREVDERTAGTIGVSIALAQQHADLLRVHDVAAVRDALTAWQRILEAGAATAS